MYLKIEPYADADLALAVGSGRDEKIPACEFLRIGRFPVVVPERLKIDELGAVAEGGRVKDIVEFDNGPQAHSLAEFPFARHTHIERKKARAVSGVAGQVAAFCADGLERKLGDEIVGQ